MSERPTPETDAACGYALTSHYGRSEGSYLQMDRSGPFVHAEVARKLERERDEAIARSKEWSDWCVEYKSERDEARKEFLIANDKMVEAECSVREIASVMEKVQQERDEAREEIKKLRYEAQIEAEHHDRMIGEFEKVYSERDELKEKYDKLATEHMLAVNKLAQERDEARAQIDDYRKRHDLLPISWEL